MGEKRVAWAAHPQLDKGMVPGFDLTTRALAPASFSISRMAHAASASSLHYEE